MNFKNVLNLNTQHKVKDNRHAGNFLSQHPEVLEFKHIKIVVANEYNKST